MPSSKKDKDKEKTDSPLSPNQPIPPPTQNQDDPADASAPEAIQTNKKRNQNLLRLGRTVARHATGMALKGLEGGPPSMEKRIAKVVLKGLDAKLKKGEREDV
jgi:hypothetical protein